MNIHEAAKKMGLDEDEYQEIVQLFIEVAQSDLIKLLSAIKARDTRQVFEVSHSIKGAAINLGLEDIADTARVLELNAHDNSLIGAEEEYTALKEKIDVLSTSI
jgi:HPt (histidine-containing phosphotransfer) domain-containing protein